jgi:hypothetical protein
MYIKFKEILYKKIIGSLMTGGPVEGGKCHSHLVAKRYPIGSRFCSSGSFSLDGKKNSTKLLSLSRDFSKVWVFSRKLKLSSFKLRL